MDPIKVDGILSWPRPKNITDVQALAGFTGFYRRFIDGYAKLFAPLYKLTKKDVPWQWHDEQEEAFQCIKRAFTTAPVLLMPDVNKPFCIECDASDFATGAVLEQKGDDNLWHPTAYISKAMDPAERNYNIHDKELLAVFRLFKAWRHYLEGAQHPVDVLSDHKNLVYFAKAQTLNRRQARWATFLTQFDFQIFHKAGPSNHSDPLSRRVNHHTGLEQDNAPKILFLARPIDVSAIAPANLDNLKKCIEDALDRDVTAKTVRLAKHSNKAVIRNNFADWNDEKGVLSFKGRLYVPHSEELRRKVVRMHHDLPAVGHPGRLRMHELAKRDFYWPGMKRFVAGYVQGCAKCQANKIRTHPPIIPLIPNDVPLRPFQVMSTDFITDLPECEGFDAVSIWVDRGYKTVYIVPTCKKVTSAETSDLFIRYVFPHTGVMEQLISDRGPQFASQISQHIFKTLGIKSTMSTAYHPQTNGQTKRFNQELEQYLRAFCDYRQDDWVKWLPLAQFAHNSQVTTSTGRSPFDLLYGFNPRSLPRIAPNVPWPDVEARLKALDNAHEEAHSALSLAADRMKDQHDSSQAPTVHQVGDRVWLEGTHLRTQRPKAKLDAKRFGPFTISAKLGHITYRLDIPKTWKNARIHPVFHSSLLMPYVKTPEHGPSHTQPPPVVMQEGDC
jgi:hypothetical protein